MQCLVIMDVTLNFPYLDEDLLLIKAMRHHASENAV